MNQRQEIKANWIGRENLSAKVLLLERRRWVLRCVSTHFWDFSVDPRCEVVRQLLEQILGVGS